MTESSRPLNGRFGSNRSGDSEASKPIITGRSIPITSTPSFQNVWGGLYNSLPAMVRDMLPLGEEPNSDGSGPEEPVKDKRSGNSWQDVCFIYDIPGEDNDEGLVILADGSMRRYIQCKGVNALLFDEQDRNTLAQNFANFANSCDSDIQILVKARNLPVDEYLSRYQILLKTENEYLKWYADYTDKWFRRVQDLSFVPQRDFYVIVSYQPPDCKTNTGKPWDGRRSIQKHEEYLETLHRLAKTTTEQLRGANLRPHVLTRKEVRNLIYQDLNPSLAQKEHEAPPSREGLSEA